MTKWGSFIWGTDLWGSEEATGGSGSDLSTFASLIGAYTVGPGAVPREVVRDNTNITSSIFSFNYSEFPSSITVSTPSDISAAIEAVVANIGGSIYSIPPKNLPAYIGGHAPGLLLANIYGIAPSDISGWLITNTAGTSDISAVLAATGTISHISGSIITTVPTYEDISSILRVKEPVDIPASLYGWDTSGLSASIAHTYVAPDFYGIIKGIASVYSDIPGWIIASRSEIVDLPSSLRSYTSTHTSNKPYNIGLFSESFPFNRYVVGTPLGASFISIEPIFGNFPDLSVLITGVDFSKSNLSANIFGYLSTSTDIGASVLGIVPRISLNKVRLDFVYFKTLGASITPVGEFRGLYACIKSYVPTSTGTADDARFIRISSTTRKFVSTSGGLLIFNPITSVDTFLTFINNHLRPDLRAVVHGWDTAELYASIVPSLQKDLGATLGVFDASHMSNLPALLQSYVLSDITSTITSTGYFSDVSATITTQYVAVSMPARINAYVGVSSREVLTVHTKPFSNLYASINFNESYLCSINSGYKELSSFISAEAAGVSDISSTITALAETRDITASIAGINRVRIKVLSLFFRARTRDSEGMYAYIKGWSDATQSDLLTTITGLYQAVDLSSSITAVRYKPADVGESEVVNLVNITNPEVEEYADVLFGAGVDSYIFNPADNKIYSSDLSQWSILIRQIKESDGFFLDAPGKKVYVRSMEGFDSLDEAIRDSLDRIVNPYNYDLSCSITCTGGFSSLTASVVITSADRVLDLGAKIVESTIPDISAIITATGGYSSLYSVIGAVSSEVSTLQVSIIPSRCEDILSTITAI